MNMLVGLPMMLLCLVVQAAIAFWSVRYYVRQRQRRRAAPVCWRQSGPADRHAGHDARQLRADRRCGACCSWCWASSSEFYEAIYHSAVNFASLGYGDIVMSKRWKLLGPLEAVNGVLMLGMTSAALMVILQQLIKGQRDEIFAAARRSIGDKRGGPLEL